MNSPTEEIFKAFESNTLVFSSQVVADSYVYSYAKKYGSAFKDRALSWDRFKEKALDDKTKGLKKADDTDRLLFVRQFKDINRLKYFASSKYPEALPAFRRSIARQISRLCTAYGDRNSIKAELCDLNPSADLLNDIHILVPAYRQYLNERSLYDPNLLTPDFSNLKGYTIVFPETFRDPDVAEAIKYCNVIHNRADDGLFKGFEVYNNSTSEIRGTVRRIRKLLENNVNPSDIAISCADIKAYRPFLEYEAGIRDIKLDFQDSRALSQLPPGRFITAFLRARKSNWSYRNIRLLILDPMTPFEDEDIYPYVVNLANKLKISEGGLDAWQYKLDRNRIEPDLYGTEEEKEKDRLAFEAFERLKNAAENFDRQISTDRISEALMTLCKAILKDHYWTSRDEVLPEGTFSAVFGSCVDELKKLENKVQREGNLSSEETLDIYADLLDSVSYLENRKTMGVRVYSYPLSAGLCVENHFVINLSDSAVRCVRQKYPFLDDGEGGDDISRSILACYLETGAVLSGCEESFSGPCVMPTDFLEKERSFARLKVKDSFDYELDYNALKVDYIKMTSVQKEGFVRFIDTCSKYDSKPEFDKTNETLELSISKIKDFEACPYKVFASEILRLREYLYEMNLEDNAEIGNLLHRTVQTALRQSKKIKDIPAQKLAELLKYQVYKVYQGQKNAPPKSYLDHIYKTYEMIISRFVTAAQDIEMGIGDYSLAGMEDETKGSVKSGSVTYSGKADLVLENSNGEYAVIDLKKNADNYYKPKTLEKTSLQVAMYALLLETNPKYAKTPVYGGYYSFISGEYLPVWPNNKGKWDIDRVENNRNKRLDAISETVKNNDYFPKIGEGCAHCPYSTLCRGGYEIR